MSGLGERCRTHVNSPRHTSACGELAKIGELAIQPQGQRVRAVHVLFDHRHPVVREIPRQLELHARVVDRDVRRQDETDDRIEEALPASAGSAIEAVALRLLEGVIDGDREGWVCLLSKAVHRLHHAVEEKRLRLLLTAVALGRGHQFLGLGNGEGSEEFREHQPQ